MKPTFTLGRVAGVEIGINWSWLIVVALIGWSLAAAVFPETTPDRASETYLLMAAVAVPLFFACLLLHELGHAMQAQREGMAIDGITLWVLGGVARFRGTFPSAGAEFRIAIAGPLVTLALTALLLALSLAVPLPAAVEGVVYWLGSVNLLLLAFNLLPALPLDGGRVLRAVLWQLKGDYVGATRTAAALGRVFGQILITGGIFLALFTGSFSGVWLTLIGWFVLLAAEAERQSAIAHVALAGLRVQDAMVAAPDVVGAEVPLERFMDDVFAHTRHAAYPVVLDGHPVGMIAFGDVAALPRSTWPGLRAADRMRTIEDVVVVRPGDALEEAWPRLVTSPLKRALVLEGDRLTGLLSATDVSRLLAAAEQAGTRKPTVTSSHAA
jgi:Zn-dependent protease/CBS domain-containing protein